VPPSDPQADLPGGHLTSVRSGVPIGLAARSPGPVHAACSNRTVRSPGVGSGRRPGAGSVASVPPHDLPARRGPDEPHPSRLAPDHPRRAAILAAHQGALDTGADSYADPDTGFTVLTSAYLARRGTCCDSGCRHCPYIGGTVSGPP
jgi:hypothetical protein